MGWLWQQGTSGKCRAGAQRAPHLLSAYNPPARLTAHRSGGTTFQNPSKITKITFPKIPKTLSFISLQIAVAPRYSTLCGLWWCRGVSSTLHSRQVFDFFSPLHPGFKQEFQLLARFISNNNSQILVCYRWLSPQEIRIAPDWRLHFREQYDLTSNSGLVRPGFGDHGVEIILSNFCQNGAWLLTIDFCENPSTLRQHDLLSCIILNIHCLSFPLLGLCRSNSKEATQNQVSTNLCKPVSS